MLTHRASQAFGGKGCVATSVTYCACQHLTDFASASAPKISVCSAKDLLSLSPSDIVTKLRLFLYLICGLFGGAAAPLSLITAIHLDRKLESCVHATVLNVPN